MKRLTVLAATLSPLLMAASCGSGYSTGGDGNDAVSTPAPSASFDGSFSITERGTFERPWASAFIPGTDVLVITEKAGTAKFVDTATNRMGTITGLPQVDGGDRVACAPVELPHLLLEFQ